MACGVFRVSRGDTHAWRRDGQGRRAGRRVPQPDHDRRQNWSATPLPQGGTPLDNESAPHQWGAHNHIPAGPASQKVASQIAS